VSGSWRTARKRAWWQRQSCRCLHAGRGPQAQTRTEQRVEELAQRVAELAQVQTSFGRTFMLQVGGLGARWGMQTEAAFRAGMRTIPKDLGLPQRA
jgi:hypothetical protein